jgi:TolA-binding protein
MPTPESGSFDLIVNIAAAYAVAAGTAALAWVWKTDRTVALMGNDSTHHQNEFKQLKEEFQQMNKKLDKLSDIAKDIQHDMPKRRADQ